MTEEKIDPRLIVDETKCFICQERAPEFKTTVGNRFTKLCAPCVALVQQEINWRNRIKAALFQADRTKIFTYTLGMNLLPTKFKVEKI